MDPYAVLGVGASATDAEIRDAYLRRSKELHPDRHANATPGEQAAATRAMQDVVAAYDALRERIPFEPAQPTAAPRPYVPSPRRKPRWGLLALAAVVISTLLALLTSTSAPPPPPNPATDYDLSALEGRCITLTANGAFEDIVECTRPHDARVVKVVDHLAECPLWSDAKLPSAKQDLCLDRVPASRQ